MRKPTKAYLEKAAKLNKQEIERLLSRARKKFMRRLEDEEMSVQEVVAIQLEIEDEALHEWRAEWAEIRNRTKAT